MGRSADSLIALEVDRDRVEGLIRLAVSPGQETLVSSNAVTLAQAAYEPFSAVRGLYAQGQPVGLMAMIDYHPGHPDAEPDDPENAAYLWRLMIGAEHQRKGFGTVAMRFAFAQARRWGRTQLSVHVSELPHAAVPFYTRFGLRPTDLVDYDERLYVGPVP